MELMLLLTYAAIACVIFKIFRIPLNSFTVPTAILGAVFMIGGLIIVMNYHHPFTNVARTVTVTTPIVPLVNGRVIEVPITPNTPLKQGDVLFKIDPTPYQAEVDEQEANLAQAKKAVKILQQEFAETQAEVENERAERDRAKDRYDRLATANENARTEGRALPFPEARVVEARETYEAAEANLRVATADSQSARLRLDSEIGGVNTVIAQAKARLSAAKFDLEQTVMHAPTDGQVTQLLLRPGMIAVPMVLRPTMVFVHDEQTRLIGSFLQNSLKRIEPGNDAEVIFPSIPGRVFKGKVDFIQPVLAQGEIQATGALVGFGDVSQGRVPVGILLDAGNRALSLPTGVSAEVAVYNDDTFLIHEISLLRRILLRMTSWTHYVFGPIH
ncbi:MAG: HlyD family secretion protein [Alphaproteobacteria bacterium]|nr:HlyD family secretion protein [Alphaproteobacteria bacterium]